MVFLRTCFVGGGRLLHPPPPSIASAGGATAACVAWTSGSGDLWWAADSSAAPPVENPYCSCKLNTCSGQGRKPRLRDLGAVRAGRRPGLVAFRSLMLRPRYESAAGIPYIHR